MWNVLKYGIWNAAVPKMESVNQLVQGGYAPLAAMVLSARGMNTPQQAADCLRADAPLIDPYRMTDMAPAVERICRAKENGEKIAVFGDYDVDGVTATCLLTDFLRRQGCDCTPYIPGRLEEGYGLNPIAIHQLHGQGITLIITVDCGITAVEEANLCRELGIDLVITDHHECKETLPPAVAVIDPHRPDCTYPHRTLSGVGVAFKLASAICGNQQKVLQDYADMVCLGTVADVMPLSGENRVFVCQGLEALRQTHRPGIAALIAQCGCDAQTLSASSVGYMLAPRINAAGRMGQIHLAVDLFLTEDPETGAALAESLCELNRQRQAVESEIYQQVLEMLPEDGQPEALVLADENWHQGVVGIVASRIAEEYCCPTFLISLDGDHGKASSRSYGGFNLFSALTELSPLLESYGGHELAAGFTIHRSQIPAFRQAICQRAAAYYASGAPRTVLEADCVIPPELLTMKNVDSLKVLEPCGNSCPKPLLIMENMQIDRLSAVGGGRHLRLRLKQDRFSFQAIFFSCTAASASVCEGDLVDVAFMPQLNEFRGEKTVQMNLVDIRPSCKAECSPELFGYHALRSGEEIACARELLPDRQTLATIWRYLAALPGSTVTDSPICLCRKIVRRSGEPLSLGKFLTALDIFSDVNLITVRTQPKYITIGLIPTQEKADLSQSQTMQRLIAAKESE